MKSKFEELVERLRVTPHQRELVSPVTGESLLAWCDRQGAVRLTKTENGSMLEPQGATSEGVGAENDP